MSRLEFLEAENARLRARVEYLERLVEAPIEDHDSDPLIVALASYDRHDTQPCPAGE